MLNEDFEVYDSCDLKRPSIPPRSRLYHLEPIGIGTPYVESLTSYIARLAEAHCLTPKILLEQEIDRINIKLSSQSKSFGIRQYSGEINGRGETASILISLLKELTLIKRLEWTTLVSLSEILPRKKLVKTIKAWCPFCYQDFVNQNRTLYEPLIWSVDVVKTCSIHKIPLANSCDRCKKQFPPLSSNSRVGFCPKCGQWLGQENNENIHHVRRKVKSENRWDDYVNENIENLISASQCSIKTMPRELIAKSLNLCIELLTQGNIAAFSRLLNFPKNSVWMWSKGKSVPSY